MHLYLRLFLSEAERVLVKFFSGSVLVSPDTVMWLWERRIGFRGLLRAISVSVLGDCFSASLSPADGVLTRPRPNSLTSPMSLGPSPFPRMTVSFSSIVSPTVRLVSVSTSRSGSSLLGGEWSMKSAAGGSV